MQQENVERTIGFVGRLGAAIMGTVIERSIVALLGAFSTEHLQILMDQDYYIIETTLNATKRRPQYEKYDFTEEQIRQLEHKRLTMAKRTLGLMGMIRTLASKFPGFSEELTLENVRAWLRKEQPALLDVMDKHPNKKWLENQVDEIKRYFWRV